MVSALETVTECLPESDQFSSCADLMRNPTLRAFIWILGISALFGNAFVLYERLRPNEHSRVRDMARVQNCMVGNLAIADGLMGVYMLIIASADVAYRNQYAYYAEEWQTSVVCKIAGILSVISSEASVFFITAISVDRFVAVLFPHSRLKMKLKSAYYVASLIWVITLVISVVPLMVSGVHDTFYGRSSVCLAIPLTSSRPLGWQYSVAVFLGLNFIAFTMILVSYVAIYLTMKLSSARAGVSNKSRSQEYQLALRMSLLVFSDMCCWMPIIIMGLISLTGSADIPATSYAWIAVFVLPLNSSLNPYLYTIFTRQSSARRKLSSSIFSKSAGSNDVSMANPNKAYAPDSDAEADIGKK